MSGELSDGIEDFYPTECVLCDFVAETPKEYEKHTEIHND